MPRIKQYIHRELYRQHLLPTILSSSQQQPNNTKKAVCRVTGIFPAVTSKHFCEGLLHLFVLLVFSFITAAHGRWIARILHILWGRFNTF